MPKTPAPKKRGRPAKPDASPESLKRRERRERKAKGLGRRPGGRPAMGERIALILPAELADKIDDWSEQFGRYKPTRSAAIRDLVERGLEVKI